MPKEYTLFIPIIHFQLNSSTIPTNYELVGRLIEELKLRKYSYRKGKKYREIVLKFLKSGKNPREFLLSYSNKSRGRKYNERTIQQIVKKAAKKAGIKKKVTPHTLRQLCYPLT